MFRTFEDGLHPVSQYPTQQGQYSTLPQVYEPVEKAAQPAPQAYLAEKSPEAAPVPIAEDGNPPRYVSGSVDFDMNDKSLRPNEQKRLMGIGSRRLIWTSVVVLVIIIALAIGIGVGLSRNQRDGAATQASSSLTTRSSSVVTTSMSATGTATRASSVALTTASSTPSAVATSGFTGISEVQCPSINNTIATSGTSRFQVLCAVHWITGQPAANNNGTVRAIGGTKLVAYSLQQCLEYCVQYNNQLNRTIIPEQNGSGCLAVTYNANLTNAFQQFEQNCFLKDREGVYDPAADTTESAVLISI